MAHDYSYYEDEVRDNFYIPSMGKRSWAMQMDVLDKVREICDRHGLKWFADYGTLLGCIRHGGFIPWDDDLDICMLRDDYDKFIEVAVSELPSTYLILDSFTDFRHTNFVTRVVNCGEISFSSDFLAENNGYPFVSGIDIFPLDYLYPDNDREEERKKRAKDLFDYAERVKSDKSISAHEAYSTARKIAGVELDKSIPIEAAFIRAITKIYEEAPKEGATHVGSMYFWTRSTSHKYPIEFFEKAAIMPFEDGFVNVPLGYTSKLQGDYGGWEKISKKGGMHEYPCYGSQESILEKHYKGKLPYRYYYDEAILSEDTDREKSNKDKCLEYLSLMLKAHTYFMGMYETGKIEEAAGILQACQNMAISAGSLIEFCNGEGSDEVKLLESYCEAIYAIHSKLLGGMNLSITDNDIDSLNQLINYVFNSIQNDFLKKTIVFIPYKASDFSYIRGMYNRYINDPSWNVKVMPVPYFYKNFDGTNIEEHFEFDEFPKDITLTNYNEVDLASLHADVIVTMNPFDEFHSAVTLYPFFYSKNLKAKTEKLIVAYNLSFDAPSLTDEKMCSNCSQFVISPGVMRGDEVVVKSQAWKDFFIGLLDDKCGTITHDIWDEKIVVMEETDCTLNQCDDGTSDAHNGLKELLFYINFSEFFLGPTKMMDKISRVLDDFEKNSHDMSFIWKAEETLLDNVKLACPEHYDRFKGLVDRFKAIENARWDEGRFNELDFTNIRGYYGNKGLYMHLCEERHLPIMLLNADV